MKKVIILKYGELSTKGDNLSFFLKRLKINIERSLKNIDNTNIEYDYGRMFIYTEMFDEVLDKLKKVFGIHEINIGYIIDTNDLEVIGSSLLEKLNDTNFKTFKVVTKRSYKPYPISSMDVSRTLGGVILKNIPTIKVDVINPEVFVNVEIRKEESLIYFDKIKGLGGYPVGTQGKGLLMLSGGIDSPVAGYLAIKRGISLNCLYFDSPPHTSEKATDKVVRLAKVLKEYDLKCGMFVVNFTKIQETILKNCPHDYLITIMRRMMYRIAEKLANRKGMHVIVNGESIGQVASQTLTSMKAINEVIKLPVIRPVACLDKLEIIDIAKSINTYETSILPFEDCCTIFVPKHPVINPDIALCIEYEKSFDYEKLIEEAVQSIKFIKLETETAYYDVL